jgi:hypothetical protein
MVIRVLVASVLLFLASPGAWAEEMCGDLPCRANGLPYVSEVGGIIIQPGEEFTVELKIADGKVSGVEPRKLRDDIKNSIDLSFNTSRNGVILTVSNRTGHLIKYDAFMKLPNGQLRPTSSCPAMSGPFGMESWPHAIEYLELRNFRILAQGSGLVCQ